MLAGPSLTTDALQPSKLNVTSSSLVARFDDDLFAERYLACLPSSGSAAQKTVHTVLRSRTMRDTARLRFPMRMITTGAPKAGEKFFPGLTAETRL